MISLNLSDIMSMAPQLILIGGGLSVMVAQLVLRKNAPVAAWNLTMLTLIIAGLVTVAGLSDVDGKITFLPRAFLGVDTVAAFNHSFRYSVFSADAILLLIFLLLMVVMSMRAIMPQLELNFAENYFLILMSAAGFSYAVCSEDLVTLFVAIELGSLPIIILLGINRNDKATNEAALKYLLLSSFAIAFLLLGIALLYGATGTLKLRELKEVVPHFTKTRVITLAYTFVLAGFFFKITAFPLHAYAADVYEGSVSVFTGILASFSKVASILLLFKISMGMHDLYRPYLAPIFTLASACSMLFGSLASLWPRNLKRILAYSSIANAGYMLAFFVIPVGTDAALMGTLKQEGGSALYIYASSYAMSVLLAFLVIQVLEKKANGPVTFDNVGAAAAKSPLAKWGLAVALLSAMGIPPLAGFFGKFFLFRYLALSGNLTLAACAALATGISVYAYIRVVQPLFFGGNKAVEGGGAGNADSGLRFAFYTLIALITFFAAFTGFLYNSGIISIQKIY